MKYCIPYTYSTQLKLFKATDVRLESSRGRVHGGDRFKCYYCALYTEKNLHFFTHLIEFKFLDLIRFKLFEIVFLYIKKSYRT